MTAEARLQIIKRILGPVLTVTIFATIVAYAWSKGYDVHLTNTVIPVVAVVVSRVACCHADARLTTSPYAGRFDTRLQVFLSIFKLSRGWAKGSWMNRRNGSV